MSLVTKVETVFVRVCDLEKSLEWYQRVLGLSIKWKSEDRNAVAFSTGGETDITLVRESQVEKLSDNTFNFFVKDIITFQQQLKNEGIDVSEVKKWFNIEYISFKDLEGNFLEACHYNA